ncbi:MAG: hypothetical protein ACI8WB_001611 [Phenylobacterium sp.]
MAYKRLIINAMMFYVAWFGCIFIGNLFIPVVLIWLGFHLRDCESPTVEFSFLILVTVTGSAIDSALIHFGVFVFSGHSWLIPWWLMFIWLSFALTINGCLAFLRRSIVLQLLAGMVLAPLSYIGGSAFGVVEFGYSTAVTFAILSVVWSMLLPAIYSLNKIIPYFHRGKK